MLEIEASSSSETAALPTRRPVGAINLAGISSTVRTSSTTSAWMALLGMLSWSAVSGRCANVSPPCFLIAARPSVPSLPAPEKTIPMALAPLFSKRSKERVDRVIAGLSGHHEHSKFDLELVSRRDDVYVIGFRRNAGLRLLNGHPRVLSDQTAQDAFMAC